MGAMYPTTAPAFRSIELRALLTTYIHTVGEASVAELVRLVEAERAVSGGRTSKLVSDALRAEVSKGWVRRVGRGRYAAGRVPKSSRSRMRSRIRDARTRRDASLTGMLAGELAAAGAASVAACRSEAEPGVATRVEAHGACRSEAEPQGPSAAAAIASLAMVDLDEHGRPEPPLTADEAGMLVGFLEYQRATLAWKCRGLDADGMSTVVGASSMSLGGLLKHMAYVEDSWFSRSLHGRAPHPPWDTVDWRADQDWDWHSAAEDSPEELVELWEASVARSRTALDEALADGGLDRLAARTWPDGRAPSLRWILCHMIEEYARHNGHADLLRESVDGLTGE